MVTVIVIILTAVMACFSGWALIRRVPFFADNLDQYGVPRKWWPWLGTAKICGGIGVLAGLWWTPVGVVAAAALALYFTGAVVTVVRAHAYSHVPIPLVYLAPPTAAGVLLAIS